MSHSQIAHHNVIQMNRSLNMRMQIHLIFLHKIHILLRASFILLLYHILILNDKIQCILFHAMKYASYHLIANIVHIGGGGATVHEKLNTRLSN